MEQIWVLLLLLKTDGLKLKKNVKKKLSRQCYYEENVDRLIA